MNNLEIPAQKVDGRLEFRPDDKLAYQVYVDDHPEGKWFNIKVSVAKIPITPKQRGYYYVALVPIWHRHLLHNGIIKEVLGVKEAYGEKEADRLLKLHCGRIDEGGNIVMHDSENYPDRPVMSMSEGEASKDQMRQLIENAKNFLTDFCQCKIPERTD